MNIDENGDGLIDGFQFQLRSPFYTANPMSSITIFELSIDGKKIDNEKIVFIIRGMKIPAKYAYTFHEISWAFYELINVFVEKPGGIEEGKHKLFCNIKRRFQG